MRNCSLRAISPFPTMFPKVLYCRHVKTRVCLGKGKLSAFPYNSAKNSYNAQ